jgi:ketosteroid isomerase-like protein
VNGGEGVQETQIREMFRKVDGSEWGALPEFFHADIVYERPGYSPLVGLERVLRFYREERVIACGKHSIDRVVVGDGAGACWGRLEGTLKDGSPTDERFADVYLFEGGKIRSRRSFFFRPAI